MHKNKILLSVSLVFIFITQSLHAQQALEIRDYQSVITGAMQFDAYLPLLKNKRVAILTNVSGKVGNTSIVDTLLSLKVDIWKIFGPEHGFRADADAGEKVQNARDEKTGIPVISLYGNNKKPTADQLGDIDVLVYDIQDIGVRFYTYISTMCYAMEACAENGKEMIVLDRPNPNGFYIDGPVLKKEVKSFLGLHPVPIVYGMTCGEYAQMANNEGWLKNGVKCKLKVITMKNYERSAAYHLPTKPSPNIPNTRAILLYPSLGLFEGTIMSLGRGTEFPFQVLGHPAYPDSAFKFTPLPSKLSQKPRYVNQICKGIDLRQEDILNTHPRKIELKWLITTYQMMADTGFFEKTFDAHAGNTLLKKQIRSGLNEEAIRKTWQKDLQCFKKIRKKYLLYADVK